MVQRSARIENTKDLIELAPVGTIIHDRLVIRYVNNFLVKLLGYASAEDLIGTPVLDIVHPDFRNEVKMRIGWIETESAMTAPREVCMLHRDGSAVDVEATGFPISYGDDEAVQVIIQDISKRKNAERQLIEHKKRLEGTLQKIQGIVWRADALTFRFEFVSEKAEAILGYPVSRWINEETFWPDHIHPEDRGWTYDFCMAQTKALQYHEFEYRMIAADGRTVWLRDCVSVEHDEGVPKTLYGLMTDITLTKKLERGLYESESRYRLMAENASDIILRLNATGKISYVSPSVERILGFSTAQVLANDPFTLIHPDDLALVKSFIAAVTKESPAGRVQYRCRNARGEFVWLEAVMTSIADAATLEQEILITSRDISERKRYENRLQESHDLLRKISVQIPGIIFQLRRDPSGNFHFPYISETARQIGELNPENMSVNFDIVVSRIHPIDRDHYLNSIKRSADNISKISIEYRIILPKAGIRWRLAEAQPEREEDGSIVWHGHVSDITERKLMQDALFESEERVRTMAEHSPIGIFMVNDQGDNIFASNWFCTKLGADLHELMGRDWVAFIHEDHRERAMSAWNDFWEKDWPYDMEYTAVSKTGQRLDLHAKAEKLYKNKKFLGAVGIVEDITDKKSFERQIRDLSAKLIDLSERERSEISREIHDSVGQNLVILKLRLQQRMEKLPAEQQQILGEFFEPIDNVLASSREISRKLSPIHLQTLGLSLAIEDLCDHIRKLRPFTIDLKLNGLDEFFVPDLHIQVYRIVQEAITNVLKHSNATHLMIRFESNGSRHVLSVSDNGTNAGPELEQSDGIGLQIMRERARTLGAEFNFLKNQYGAEVCLEINRNPL